MTGWRRMVPVAMLSLLLAGCWQSRSQPYHFVTSVAPFGSGAVTETGPDGKVTHYRLVRIPRGRYLMTQSDQGQDFGQGFELGFFPLPGAPKNVFVYGAALLNHPKNEETLRYFGLMEVTGKTSAREMRPDCDKDAKASLAAGVSAGKDGACTFKTRAELETALLALWKSGKKAEYSYTLK